MDIESEEVDKLLPLLNEHIKDKNNNIKVDGYPTIYKIIDGKPYYHTDGNNRNYNHLTNWLKE